MTCVVGVTDGTTVWIGADSAGVNGDSFALQARADPKVFRRGALVMGFCGSFRAGQLLRLTLVPPAQLKDEPDELYVCTRLTAAIRRCLREGGVEDEKRLEDSTLLVGYHGRLFAIDLDDHQVAEQTHRFQAIGCAADIAHGSLYATRGGAPVARVLAALEAAQTFSAGVRAPFLMESA